MTTPAPDEIEQAYDAWSQVYDSDRNATRDLDALALGAQSLQLEDADVLELGCGTGKNTGWLATRARSVLALDFSEGMLARARARITSDRVTFLRHDLRRTWPAADAAFDVAVIDLVLEHIDRLQPIFAEAARVLRPGGRLFVCELHPFRQLGGSQAQFVAPGATEPRRVRAYRHTVADFLNAGVAAGLHLTRADEWHDAGATPGSPPRLFSMLWRR
jgi:malonyl-CoA O-methyltransferase